MLGEAQTIDFGSYPVLPYWTKVRGPLFEILATILNVVDRDLRPELEARAKGTTTWLLTHVRVAQETFEAVERLATQAKAQSVRLQAAVTVPPLARVIVDSLFSVTFVFENPAERLPWFWKSTWREIHNELEELTADHGTDPVWQPSLTLLATERDAWRDLLAAHGTPLTAAQLANPRGIDYWPNPGKMPSLSRDPVRKASLDYLRLKFYGGLSAASHLSGTGILAQGGAFLRDMPDDTHRKYFSDQVLYAMTGLFALVSEIAIEVIRDPALARRVLGLWQTENLWGTATETYDRCFKARLDPLAAR